ncbi:hypothetical protein D9M68_222520 [compost metagenome]
MKSQVFATLFLAGLSVSAFALPVEDHPQLPEARAEANDLLLSTGDGWQRTGGKAERNLKPASEATEIALGDGFERTGGKAPRNVRGDDRSRSEVALGDGFERTGGKAERKSNAEGKARFELARGDGFERVGGKRTRVA